MSDDSAREFVDSNVLVYAHDLSAGPKRERAAELLARLWDSGGGCLSIQVLQEFFVTITRKVSRPLAAETAAAHVADLGQWRVHRPSVKDLLEAIDLQGRNRISFWDAMVMRSALELGCGVVWSEDLSSGQRFDGLEVQNPFGGVLGNVSRTALSPAKRLPGRRPARVGAPSRDGRRL